MATLPLAVLSGRAVASDLLVVSDDNVRSLTASVRKCEKRGPMRGDR